MKIYSPLDRDDLHIHKRDRVLEVGPGHNPSFRSNVIVEKFIDVNDHRCGDLKIYPHQTLIQAEGEKLPFRDKEFDYAICNQVLEHAESPADFIAEQCRVARRGYIETPSLLGEFLFPKPSHKWVILEIDNKLVFYEKAKMPGNYANNYGELFLNYLPFQSLPYKLLWFTEGDIMINRYEWQDNIDFIVNPQDPYYLSFFTRPWTREMVEKLFPRRPLARELYKMFRAAKHLARQKWHQKFSKHHPPLTLAEYLAQRENIKNHI